MKAFPVKPQTLWRQAFPGLLLGAFASRAATWMNGEPFSWPNTVPLMVIAAAMVVAIYFLQPTLCGASGVKAVNTWGFRKHVAWNEITSVSFGRLYLLQPSLKIIDCNGRRYWIARDTKDLGSMHALAKIHGGACHPLTLALETPLYQL
jgi:hypothetical protein